MNKDVLLKYAQFARNELETQIGLSLKKLGITENGILDIKKLGDVYVIDGSHNSITVQEFKARESIINNYINNSSFQNVVEEFSYTWFNRIIAIRFMEVHEYFSHGFRVLTSRDGSYEPEILQNVDFVINDLGLSEDTVNNYKSNSKLEELYKYILVNQCKKLSCVIPMLFDDDGKYLEYLLPSNLLSQDSIIRKITDIPEEDFLNDVEVVGWLYQDYVSANREFYRKAKKVTKELIPTLSQVFTPDWIVRYMAENSVGRIWIESYPNSSLKSKMKYYIDDAKQEKEVQEKINEIKYKNVNPKDIKIIEPCCGSGHILVYVFDLLFEMYLELGYEKKVIPSLILENNLFGLDVDKRAAQLAEFSLIMKARSIDNKFFNEDRFIKPNVYEILDSQGIINYKDNIKGLNFSTKFLDIADYLVNTFKDGKIIGTLLKIKNLNYEDFINEFETVKNNSSLLPAERLILDNLNILIKLAKIADILSKKYDVMITNPPYLGISKIDKNAKEYLIKNYPNSKSDMFAMFMEAGLVSQNGFRAIINPDSWMFLASYYELRSKILSKESIITLAHLGLGAMDATVQTVVFVIRNTIMNYLGKYYRLFKEKDKANALLNNKYFLSTSKRFENIPGCPIAYWISDNLIDVFKNGIILKECGDTRQGMATSDNNRFLRFWFEVNTNKTYFNSFSSSDANNSKCKWFPYNKGGDYRKWFGNQDYIVNYENDGKEIKNYASSLYRTPTRTIKSISEYFKECLSWSKISSGTIAFRFYPYGFIFDVAGCCIFYNNRDKMFYDFGFINSKVAETILKAISPTLNYEVGQIAILPIIDCNSKKNEIINIVKENINISKDEWDSYETSWNFKKHPMVAKNSSIESLYNSWEELVNKWFYNLKDNEEKLNEIFIDIYGLKDELTPQEDDKLVSIRKVTKNDSVKSLISYLIGLNMGRYSLDREGIAFAGGKWDPKKYVTYTPDDDGIIPLYQYTDINDGLLKVLCNLIKHIYGEEYYKDNINFIAKALGQKANETPEETLNNYLNNNFYEDHLKTYRNRPIYWMLSSGKQGAFKCLIYLHRYNKNTLGLVNSKYFLPRTAFYRTEREKLETKLKDASLSASNKKKLEKELSNIQKCESELFEYGQILDYLANQYIELDLDDGVKVNYLKFQKVSLKVNSSTIKKDLLVPFGLEKEK